MGRHRHQSPCGARGTSRSRQPSSSRSRSPFSTLWRRHAATTLLQSCRPPRLRGTMWSTVSACSPQYAQRMRSRARTARRVTGGMRACGGSRTSVVSRTIEGTVTDIRGDRMIRGSSCVATASARPTRRRTTALRSVTSCRGSYVAFSRSTRPMGGHPTVGVLERAATNGVQPRRRRPRVTHPRRRTPSPCGTTSTAGPAREGTVVGATTPSVRSGRRHAPPATTTRGDARPPRRRQRASPSRGREVRSRRCGGRSPIALRGGGGRASSG